MECDIVVLQLMNHTLYKLTLRCYHPMTGWTFYGQNVYQPVGLSDPNLKDII